MLFGCCVHWSRITAARGRKLRDGGGDDDDDGGDGGGPHDGNDGGDDDDEKKRAKTVRKSLKTAENGEKRPKTVKKRPFLRHLKGLDGSF